MNETHVTVVGNVVSAITPRTVADGALVVNFRVASNARRLDRATGEWMDGDQLFAQVSCWRRLAENVLDCLVTGDPVVVTGRLYTRSYEVEGDRRSQVAIEATAVGVELSRHRVVSVRPGRRGAGAADGDAPAGTRGSESVAPVGREVVDPDGAAGPPGERVPALAAAPGADGA